MKKQWLDDGFSYLEIVPFFFGVFFYIGKFAELRALSSNPFHFRGSQESTCSNGGFAI